MKPCVVSSLQDGQNITSHFLVCEKEIRATREGKSYLRLELGDATGRVEARMWDGFEKLVEGFAQDDFVKVQARVENYRNKLQLMIDKIRRAEESEIDTADFFPHTNEDVEKLYRKLLEVVASVGNPWLRELLDSVTRDPELVPKWKRAPAAKVMHHAYIGGLLEHVVGLCGLGKLAAQHYPELSLDLLLTVAILHDVGKLEELCYDRAIGYTTEGQLLGHIVMELETVTNAMNTIADFPANLKTVVQHLLISHHGQYEFGSPKLPMIREAMVFHYLDDMDSKMAAVRSALANDSAEDEWSTYSPALGRKFLKLDAYLKPPTTPIP
jgi:3'-5' exoribonuclease